MALVKQQHKDLDIRFVFMNARNKIYKGSRTTYADWCNKHDFRWERSQYLWSGLKMDEDEIIEFVKKMDLKKGHYYIILTDVGDDKFKMHAYDTTGNKYENEMDHSVGSVIHEGLVGILTGKSEEGIQLWYVRACLSITQAKEYLVQDRR